VLQLGILLAIFCAFATNVAFLLKHRGACAAPDVSLRHPVASAIGLFRSKWFAVGMLVALGAWVFHVAALAMAPLSVVQAVIAGGLVCSVGTRQWAGVGLTALGLVLLAITLPHHGGHSSYSTVGMIAFESALLALGTFLVLSKKLDSHEHHGVMLGTAAGILFGVSDVAIKAITTSLGTGGGIAVLTPWLVTCIAASVIAFFACARGLQKGEAVPVITLTSAAANVTAISGGILVFGDPMPGDPIGIFLQSFAFVLVIVAAALMPAPLRVGRATA
jgi:hypothetical protein